MKKEIERPTRNQLLRENARLRGDLLTVAHRISHDLRTPLGGIVTASEFLKEVLAENNPSSSAFMSPIFDSADGMAKLIERMSCVLKASANPLPKVRVQMGEIIFRTLQRFEGKILKKNAAVSEPPAWPKVSGVFSWLEIIWGNFLANALQYGKDRIEFGWQEKNGEFLFWIYDNGDGVAPEKRAVLFQPFDSLHEPSAAGGLGLAIVQRLVKLQGGNCGYEHPSTGGSRFFFTLPADKSTGAPGSPAISKKFGTKDAR